MDLRQLRGCGARDGARGAEHGQLEGWACSAPLQCQLQEFEAALGGLFTPRSHTPPSLQSSPRMYNALLRSHLHVCAHVPPLSLTNTGAHAQPPFEVPRALVCVPRHHCECPCACEAPGGPGRPHLLHCRTRMIPGKRGVATARDRKARGGAPMAELLRARVERNTRPRPQIRVHVCP